MIKRKTILNDLFKGLHYNISMTIGLILYLQNLTYNYIRNSAINRKVSKMTD